MRVLPALLLLLVLPGLLLPAGFVLHVCLCAVAAAGPADAPQADCCGATRAQGARAHAGTCCHRISGGAPADDAPGPRASRDDCSCLWIQAPEHKPAPAPLGQAPDPRLDAPLVGWAIAVPGLADGGDLLAWPCAESRPPPPDRHRNLPLLL